MKPGFHALLICSVPIKINDSDENMSTHAPLQCSCHPRASNALKPFIAPKFPSLARALLTSRLRSPLADLILSSPRLPVPALLKPALSTASHPISFLHRLSWKKCLRHILDGFLSHSTSNSSNKTRISPLFYHLPLPPGPSHHFSSGYGSSLLMDVLLCHQPLPSFRHNSQ